MRTYQMDFRSKETGDILNQQIIKSKDDFGIILRGRMQALGQGFKFDKRKHSAGFTKIYDLKISGCLSLSECRKSISDTGTRINKDISSTMTNAARIKSMRSLLDLFEEYNTILIK